MDGSSPNWLASSEGRQPPGADRWVCIHQMNQWVNFHNGFAMMTTPLWPPPEALSLEPAGGLCRQTA